MSNFSSISECRQGNSAGRFDVISENMSLKAFTGRFPDFIIIGAAKAGTTSLYAALLQHRQVFMPHGYLATTNTPDNKQLFLGLKEPSFFESYSSQSWRLGVDWYRSLFTGAEPDQICGEASTTYTRYPQLPHAAERIAHFIPQVKLVYSVRHPAERTYSHILQHWQTELRPGQHFNTTLQMFLKENPMPLDASRYRLQLESYLKFFKEDQIHVLFSEELRSNTETVYAELCDFLGIDRITDSSQLPGLKNRTDRRLDLVARKRFGAKLKKVPGTKLLPKDLSNKATDLLFRLLKGRQKNQFPGLDTSTRTQIIEECLPDICWLEKFTGKKLPQWRV